MERYHHIVKLFVVVWALYLPACQLLPPPSQEGALEPVPVTLQPGWVFPSESGLQEKIAHLQLLWQQQAWEALGKEILVALKQNPSHQRLQHLYVGWLMQQGDVTKAALLMEQLLPKSPQSGFLAYLNGKLLELKQPVGRYWHLALYEYSRASQANSNQVASEIAKAKLLFKLGNIVR
ncbi:MAG: hypothetical protein OXT67_13120, partial [Zetaproteobacteria bacterium]|nr:hypothetical protein [Zetaproteobacteria bacterium]